MEKLINQSILGGIQINQCQERWISIKKFHSQSLSFIFPSMLNSFLNVEFIILLYPKTWLFIFKAYFMSSTAIFFSNCVRLFESALWLSLEQFKEHRFSEGLKVMLSRANWTTNRCWTLRWESMILIGTKKQRFISNDLYVTKFKFSFFHILIIEKSVHLN